MTAIETTIPSLYDEEAEMSVLGAILLDPEMVDELLTKVERRFLYKESHKLIYDAIQALRMRNSPVDTLLVRAELEMKGRLVEAGGSQYLTTLMQILPVTANASRYAEIIQKKFMLRQLALTCGEIVNEITAPSGEAEDVYNRAQAKILDLAADKHGGPLPVAQGLEQVFRQIQQYYEKRGQTGACLGLPTGLIDLDESLCGLQAGHLYIVAGRPGMGKSSLCCRIIESVISPNKKETAKPVLFFSVEMSTSQVLYQMLCSYCKLNSHEIRRGYISTEQFKTLAIRAGQFSDAPLWIDESPDVSIYDIRARARRMKHQYDIALVVVDYLQKVRGPNLENRQVEISMISSQLKAMAKELNIPVLVAAQLNRAAEAREEKKPMLSDLRESGAIEQDADVVLTLFREEYYRPSDDNKNRCDITIAKNRTGPTASIKVAFLKEYTRFETLSIDRFPDGMDSAGQGRRERADLA